MAEYTFYLKIIHSDKNFWGTEWADDHINKNRLIPNEAMEMLTKQIEKATSSIFSNLINNTGKKKSLPPIPIFEEAVERGYFAMQDSEGHYRTLKQLSHCFDNNPELISLSIQTLRLYIRKPDGTEYGDKTISNLVYG